MWQGVWKLRYNHTPWTWKDAKHSSISFWWDIFLHPAVCCLLKTSIMKGYFISFIFLFCPPLLSHTQHLVTRLNRLVGWTILCLHDKLPCYLRTVVNLPHVTGLYQSGYRGSSFFFCWLWPGLKLQIFSFLSHPLSSVLCPTWVNSVEISFCECNPFSQRTRCNNSGT